jgi:hypothetical protein
LELRIEAVMNVLTYIDQRSHNAHAALSFDEYQIIMVSKGMG